MGIVPNRALIIKAMIFIAIYGSMMMWRRLQMETCKASRFARRGAHRDTHRQGLDVKNYSYATKESDHDILNNFKAMRFHDTPSEATKEAQRQDEEDKIWRSDKNLFDLSKNQRYELEAALSSKASENKTVVMSIVDASFMQFALNFYLLSIEKFSITNFVLICMDETSQQFMHKNGISCMLYKLPDLSKELGLSRKSGEEENEGPSKSDYGSDEYFTKTNVKTLFVLQTLKLGYSVLMSDVDIVYLKNPLPYLVCDSCDLLISKDREFWNSGFVLVKPTESSLILYNR